MLGQLEHTVLYSMLTGMLIIGWVSASSPADTARSREQQ
jgi:cytochrome b561